MIFERQDLLEQGQWRGAARRADDARAAREMLSGEQREECARREASRVSRMVSLFVFCA